MLLLNTLHKNLCKDLNAVTLIDRSNSISHEMCRVLPSESVEVPDCIVLSEKDLNLSDNDGIKKTLSFSRWGFALILLTEPGAETAEEIKKLDGYISFLLDFSDSRIMVVLKGFNKKHFFAETQMPDGIDALLKTVKARQAKPKKIAIAFIGARNEKRHGLFLSESKKFYETEIWERENRFKGFYNSFSQIINESVFQTESEFIFWVHPKVTVTFEILDELILNLCSGYAFVSEISLGFFGCTKQLFRKIGMFDERFIGSEQEDTDWFFRMKFSSIPFFERGNDKICPETPNVWPPLRGLSHTIFEEKWVRKYDDLYEWEWPYNWCRSKFHDYEKIFSDGKNSSEIENSWHGFGLAYGSSFIPRLSISSVLHENDLEEFYVLAESQFSFSIKENTFRFDFLCHEKTFIIATLLDCDSKVMHNLRIFNNQWVARQIPPNENNRDVEIRINCGMHRVFHGYIQNGYEQSIKTKLKIKKVTYRP